MVAPLNIRSTILRPLAALGVIQNGAAAYYRELRHSSDPVLAVGAWCSILDGKFMTRSYWDEVLRYCQYEAVRSRAFEYFVGNYERDHAKLVASVDVDSASEVRRRLMAASLTADHEGMARAYGDLYLSDGDARHLDKALEQAAQLGGWRLGVEWAVRMLVVAPFSPVPVARLFDELNNAAQPDLLDEVASIFTSRNLNLQASQIYAASAELLRGRPDLTISKLMPLTDARITANPTLKSFLGAVRFLRAQAEEGLGRYRPAYLAYCTLNEAERAPDIDPGHYRKGVETRGRLLVPELPPTEHPEVIQMLGFPRSGTTLLENALSAHPTVETFEEVPALTIAIDRVEKALLGKLPKEPPEVTYSMARQRYYGEIQVRRKKSQASVLVDKMPLRSGDAALLTKLFPEWRYIFSVRHPFDVVLSCFKQRFKPNPAMENFRTIASSIALYDFAMNEWFRNFSLQDPRVQYVKYDDLVTDFRKTTTSVFRFLGLDWDESVNDFAKASEARAARTPSYQKVRQGLSIGVQTYWRNYDFVFQTPEAKPLHKWAEFFGYPTK